MRVGPGTDENNPFRTAKVGDWATYRVLTTTPFGGGQPLEMEFKLVVLAKAAKSATVQTSVAVVGQVRGIAFPGSRITVDLSRPFDQFRPSALISEIDPEVKSTVTFDSEGKEKLKVGGKEYDCRWTAVKTTVNGDLGEVVTKEKVWLGKDSPMLGVVRLEMRNPLTSIKMELKESGGR